MKRNSVSPKKNHDSPQMIKGSPFTKRNNIKEERSHSNVNALTFKAMWSLINAIILIVFVVQSINNVSPSTEHRLLRSSIDVSFKTSTHEEQSDRRQSPQKNHIINSSPQNNKIRSIRKKLTQTQNILDEMVAANDHSLSFNISSPIIHIGKLTFVFIGEVLLL